MLIRIPVAYVWSHRFGIVRHLVVKEKRHNFVLHSEPYTKERNEPVWFYSWGNENWIRCPVFTYERAVVAPKAGGNTWEWHIFKRGFSPVVNTETTLTSDDGITHCGIDQSEQLWRYFWIGQRVWAQGGVRCDPCPGIAVVSTGPVTCVACISDYEG